MPRSNEPTWTSNLPFVKSSNQTLTIVAIVHFACWASCLVLGVSATWLRLQFTQGHEATFFGVAGVAIWLSIPFFACGALTIAIVKTKSRRLVTWYMLTSLVGCLCSLALVTYSVIAIVNEASVETYPRRLIIASVTSLASFVEFPTSLKSALVAFHTIGYNLQFRSKKNSLLSKSKVRPATKSDIDKGFITVMALPPRQAAELFLTMYGPHSKNTRSFASTDGFIGGGEYPSTFFDYHFRDHRRSSPDDRRKHKRKYSRRNFSRNESPDDSITPDLKEDSDNEWSGTNAVHHASNFGDRFGKETNEDGQNISKSNRLATVREAHNETSHHKDKSVAHTKSTTTTHSKDEAEGNHRAIEKKQ